MAGSVPAKDGKSNPHLSLFRIHAATGAVENQVAYFALPGAQSLYLIGPNNYWIH